MKRTFWVCLLVFGLMFSRTLVYAADFYIIPVKSVKINKNYAPVEKTGQIESYRTHDDGDLAKGVVLPTPRFTDNYNGTVTDNLTGLIWLKDASCSDYVNWMEAVDYAAGLYDGCRDCNLSDGSSAGDWRLPNRKELLSLIDIGQYNPALPSDHPFINVKLNYYWTSSTYAGNKTDPDITADNAWRVCLIKGICDNKTKTWWGIAWPVRGGQ